MSQDGTNLDALDAAALDQSGVCIGHQFVFGDQDFAGGFVDQVGGKITANQAVFKFFNDLSLICDFVDFNTIRCAAWSTG